MKATWKTPEFWATIIGNLLGILLMTGVISPEQSEALNPAVNSIIGGVLAVLTLFGFIKVQGVRKAAATAIMVAKLKNAPDDMVVHAQTIDCLDRDAQKLLEQI